ncbi:hypothetical protein ALC53_13481 [Atta colombica]|uniref:PiggyBac transposable element-derived protein domain-containing protein n=1 Tax=Atta colombica TaxID=520822 RepID=A0A195AUZ3_9HYME|nr:hypothetical protein ALC53_13481 [Atta colombica]
MNINKRIILDSEDDNSTMKNKLMRHKKRRRIIKIESSSDEDVVTENFDSAKENKGKYTQRINKITNIVIEHIKNFPAFESHYTRSQNPERMFLNPELNIRKMFNLYLGIKKYFAFSFDLQKALLYPKLSVLNEGFHNFHDNKVNMGSQEIASCCSRHLQNVTTQSHVIAYSDMCTG